MCASEQAEPGPSHLDIGSVPIIASACCISIYINSDKRYSKLWKFIVTEFCIFIIMFVFGFWQRRTNDPGASAKRVASRLTPPRPVAPRSSTAALGTYMIRRFVTAYTSTIMSRGDTRYILEIGSDNYK